MLVLIILLALVIGFCVLGHHLQDDYGTTGYGLISFVTAIIFGIWLIVHVIGWSTRAYSFNIGMEKRKAFIQTIENARKNNNPIELAAISHEISEWNQNLAEMKYDRRVFFFKDHVDPRVDTLQPIQ